MVSVKKQTKIYILVPPKNESGGPEFLHQLTNYLRYKLNFNVFLFFNESGDDLIPKAYNHYSNLMVSEIEDHCDNIVVSPEIPQLLIWMKKLQKVQKIIWWLSLDNYYYDSFQTHFPISTLLIKFLNRTLMYKYPIDIITIAKKTWGKNIFTSDPLITQAHFNLCSAKHVEIALKTNGIAKVFYISELLNEHYLTQFWKLEEKRDIVLYNPKKGMRFTKKLIKKSKNVEFVPLVNLTRDGIVELLKVAKVYIDFGNHPGRDRMPREAAILGCCIITNTEGGAKLYEDLPIKDDYKFSNFNNEIDLILGKIEDCFRDYNSVISDFDYYRKLIKSEPELFLNGLKSFFIME